MMNKNYNSEKIKIIFWAGVDWLHLKQSQQYLAENFAKLGHECIYIQPIINRKIKFRDISTIIQRVINIAKRKNKDKNSLQVITPIVFSSSTFSGKILNKILIPLFTYRISRKFSEETIHYVWWPTADVDFLLNKVNATNIVYNLVDFHHSSLTVGASLVQSEDNIAKKSSTIICTSKQLVKHAKKWNDKPIFQRTRGLDTSIYKIAEQSNMTNRIRTLGYYGGLSKRIDFYLIQKLAEEGYEIHLAGPLNKVKIPLHRNIKYFGILDPTDIPNFMENIDCTLWPYLKNEYTDAILPAKTRECLSFGKPVFSTNLNAIVEEKISGIFAYSDLYDLIDQLVNFDANKYEMLYMSEIRDYVRTGTWINIAQDELINVLKIPHL